MRDIVKPALILFIVCIIVSVSLAFTFSVTKDTIDGREAMDAEAARKEVLTAADKFSKVENLGVFLQGKPETDLVKEAYKALQGSTVAGYVISVAPKGYGGIINITVGVDTKGKVTGVKIGQNTETPGLGTKAADAPFKSQLVDITPKEPLKVVKGKKSKPEEVEAISGATITSAAVVKAVQAAVDVSAELAKKEGAVK